MKRSLVILIAVAIGLTTLPSQAAKEGELLIWLNGDKGYRGLAELGKKFEAELGIPVKVEAPEGVTDKFQQAAQSGKGPDIFLWAHDRLGEWASAGLLKPIKPKRSVKAKLFDKGWDAFTHDGKVWGYPLAFEAVSLIYNKALITDPPAGLEDVPGTVAGIKQKNKDAVPLLWDYNNPYFTWGVLASGGAYVFGEGRKGYDEKDVGVAVPGAVAALSAIVKLIDDGVMARGATYSAMESQMNDGKLAMMISGPWAWSNLRKGGIDFDLAPVPGVGGKPGRPFVGVLGAMINRTTPNEDLVIEFLENYLITPAGLKLMDDDVPIGVPANKAFYETLAASNPLIAKTKVNVDNGMLMPNIPAMGRFWSAMEAALQNATNGQTDPKSALDNAKQNILQK